MRIFVDIGHPAHVHYFRNFIQIMQQKGHEFFITARDKEVSHQLLNEYNIKYVTRGKGRTSAAGKFLYMAEADIKLFRAARKFKPDFFLSVVSPYAAQVAWLLRKPHITFDDTEHATLARKFYLPFSKKVFTPYCFTSDIGEKQIRFKSFLELCYLHPTYYKPNADILNVLGLCADEPYVFLRFVSWGASHDFGQTGLDLDTKRAIVDRFKDKYRVFISAEGSLPEDLEQYRIKIPVHRIHDVLAHASLFVGEGATMASECAMLGVPAIYINSLDAGTLQQQEQFGLISGFRNSNGVMAKIDELLINKDILVETSRRRNLMLKEMIDPTKMMVEFFENYPNDNTRKVWS
jgi:predicted glycosyltransferase